MPEFVKEYGGAVISAAINKYMYVLVKERFEANHRVSYANTTEVAIDADSIKHTIIGPAIKKYLDPEKFYEVVTVADMPGRGMGIGSSSSLAVGVVELFSNVKDVYCGNRALFDSAFELESIHSCPGYQDFLPPIFGKMQLYDINRSVSIMSTRIPNDAAEELISKCVLVYTGTYSTYTSEILTEQRSRVDELVMMKALVPEFYNALLTFDIDSMAAIIDDSWAIKKKFSVLVSNNEIEQLMEHMRRRGCRGMKILGSGGGGFVLAIVDDVASFIDENPELRCMKVGLSGSLEVTKC